MEEASKIKIPLPYVTAEPNVIHDVYITLYVLVEVCFDTLQRYDANILLFLFTCNDTISIILFLFVLHSNLIT